MQNVMLQLKLKKLLPSKINAIEMFGMHALWHTMDYIDYISNLDMLEINNNYHELSKKKLKKYPVKFYNLDSIKFIKETKNKYNFIVSDSPFLEEFYDKTGLPYFFESLFDIAEPNSIIIFNCPSEKLNEFVQLELLIRKRVESRRVKDLFFTPRNEKVMYVVLSLN